MIPLQTKENLDPQDDQRRRELHVVLKREGSVLEDEVKRGLEDISEKYLKSYARERVDNKMNRELEANLTPKIEQMFYTECPLTPQNSKDDLMAQLALMHKNGILPVLRFSGYASPNIPQRESNGVIPLLFDLRTIIIHSEHYINNIHPRSTVPDAAQYLVESPYSRYHCSQAHHCVQMVDQKFRC